MAEDTVLNNQCDTVVDVFRCILDENHYGQECESYNFNDEPVMLGIYPAEVIECPSESG